MTDRMGVETYRMGVETDRRGSFTTLEMYVVT